MTRRNHSAFGSSRGEAKRLRREGLSYAAIGEQLGISRQRAHQLINERRAYEFTPPTEEERRALLDRQGGVCAICGKQNRGRLFVDHDHATGEIRGLLCLRCNWQLAAWIRPEWLDAAAAYLRRDTL